MAAVKSRALITVLLISLLASPVYAADSGLEEQTADLRYNWKIDLTVTSVATAGWIITQAGMGSLAPSSCRWCQVNSFDSWGHDNVKWSNTGTASTLSHVSAYVLAPVAALGLDAWAAAYDDRLSDFAVDALLIAEAVALSQFTTQLVKIAVGRQRPFAHYGGGSQGPRDNISFYSGHTSLAFSLAVSTGTIATMRGYRLAPAIWGTGLAIAATAGYFRLAADKHYLTDVIAGAVIGSAFGFAIPYIFHRPRDAGPPRTTVSAIPAEGGGLIAVSGVW